MGSPKREGIKGASCFKTVKVVEESACDDLSMNVNKQSTSGSPNRLKSSGSNSKSRGSKLVPKSVEVMSSGTKS